MTGVASSRPCLVTGSPPAPTLPPRPTSRPQPFAFFSFEQAGTVVWWLPTRRAAHAGKDQVRQIPAAPAGPNSHDLGWSFKIGASKAAAALACAHQILQFASATSHRVTASCVSYLVSAA